MIYELHLEGCGLKLRCDVTDVRFSDGQRDECPLPVGDVKSPLIGTMRVVLIHSIGYVKPKAVEPESCRYETLHIKGGTGVDVTREPKPTPAPPPNRDPFPVDPVLRSLEGIYSRIEDMIDLLRDIHQLIRDKL